MSHDVAKVIAELPREIAVQYALWNGIVQQEGPQGLRRIRGFRDEKLGGKWHGMRASRLNKQWRVIYEVHADIVTVFVERITPHDYRR